MLRRSQTFRQRVRSELAAVKADLDTVKVLTAQPLVQSIREGRQFQSLHEAEFKVFSQFGDDGIIQYLIHRLSPLPDTFIEFGVEDYRESNTRFLLVNNNWRGLVMDASDEHIDYIHRDDIYWRHTLTARSAFITRDNINSLLRDAAFTGDIGLLSIDIDGNDYWVWDKIDIVDPVIVIVEYNSIFGPSIAVTVPYDPTFVRHRAHYSGQFWGASLQAFVSLAERKGYSLVGCNSVGNNAYFIRNDKLGADVPRLATAQAFIETRIRDSRDRAGQLTYLGSAERLSLIRDLNVYDLRQDKVGSLSSIMEAAL